MGVYMRPLFSACNESHEWSSLKLTGRDEDLWDLMEKHPNFIMHHEKRIGGDHIFVFINWGCDKCDDYYHIETLKEEFPEWSHEFFERWGGHDYFVIG